MPNDANALLSQENQEKVTITQVGNIINIKVADGEILNSFNSTDPSQGLGQWIALGIDTGTSDITKVKYNGNYLTAIDVMDATSVGLPAGYFVLWVKAENLPKTFTLGAEGQSTKTFTINLV